ncbi:tyrosine-type recombinase/integrase [Streptomyces sp. NPDC057909]|uniref:tyrosine-type recombinase/integrase n=1 Tax=Streptomyces sp. NPDC057909 TaxID=3346277 RepID=UPI0036EC6FBF
MEQFIAERSVSPATGMEQWVVASAETLTLHREATAFLVALRSKGRSVNTERAYAGRVALYLNYCQGRRLVWAAPTFLGLAGLQRWLVTEPLPARSPRTAGHPRFRSQTTANAVMTVVSGFLRFGAAHGWVAPATVALLSEPKTLWHLPPGYDVGEDGQWRTVDKAAFRFALTDPGYQDLSPEQIAVMISSARTARDRFLIALLACTGLRIGEALGVRQEDLHLLASSRVLGCGTVGPHLHVRRRTDNPNRALAKSRQPRTLPVTADLVALYADYQYERDSIAGTAGTRMVFVNLSRPPVGRPMSYPNTKAMFDRLARTATHAFRPHMLRHSAATTWLRGGVDRDVVQRLLGHVSPLSMERYRHVDDSETRQAVEHVEALQSRP